MRALIIDDERLARAELRRLLQAHPEIDVVGEAANIEEALDLIDELAPQLLLLDVQMPGGSGFDLLAQLDDAPAVIFTTAFDTYAMKAFEVSALDYLQKPITKERLASALDRLQPVVKDHGTVPAASRIFIKDGERCWFVELSTIELFESEGNYTRVYFAGVRPLILKSLNQLETRLDAKDFLRVSRRHIVRLGAVVEWRASAAGGLTLVLSNGAQVEMSRRRAAEFRQSASL